MNGMRMHTVRLVSAEVKRARELFPSNDKQLAALFEETGELAKALIDHSRGLDSADHVREEAVQVAAMAVRLMEEGDPSFAYRPGMVGWAAYEEDGNASK